MSVSLEPWLVIASRTRIDGTSVAAGTANFPTACFDGTSRVITSPGLLPLGTRISYSKPLTAAKKVSPALQSSGTVICTMLASVATDSATEASYSLDSFQFDPGRSPPSGSGYTITAGASSQYRKSDMISIAIISPGIQSSGAITSYSMSSTTTKNFSPGLTLEGTATWMDCREETDGVLLELGLSSFISFKGSLRSSSVPKA